MHLDVHNKNNNGLTPDFHSAYKKDHSCETTLFCIVDKILNAMENKQCCATIAIDLSAAFDTVHHDILLSVLDKQYGLQGNALKWFDTYLRPSNCKVNVHKEYSNIKTLDFSVPQGSVGGPVLFNYYTSTIQYIIPVSINVYQFSDDHSILKLFNPNKINNESNCITDLELTSTKIKQWMNENRLKMNPKKTEFIIFGSKQMLKISTTKTIRVEDQDIERGTVVKYLGTFLDEKLSFTKHLNIKCRSVMFNLQKIRKLRKFLTEDSCKILIQGLVLCHLDYAHSLYYGLPNCQIMKLRRV